MSAWPLLDHRIGIRRNPLTGSWRVTQGGRLAYYCRTYDEAVDRADELIAKHRRQRAEDLTTERYGTPAELERERTPRTRRNGDDR